MRSTPPWRVFLTRFSLLVSFGLLAIALAIAAVDESGLNSVGWNISLLLVGVGAIFSCLANSLGDHPRLTARAGWVFLLPIVYVGFQLVPLPLPLLKLFSPEGAKLAESLAPITHAPGFAPLSIHPATTGLFFLRTLGYSLTALVIYEVSRYCWSRQPWACVLPLIGIAAFEAFLGIVQSADGGEVQGTYNSRDHYAGILEMVLPLAVAYGISRMKRSDGAAGVSVFNAFKACVAFVCATAMLVGLVYSLSKTGFVAGLGALFVMGALAVLSKFKGVRGWIAVAGLGISVIVIFLFLPTNQLADAYSGFVSSDPGSLEGRAPIWNDSRHLLSDYPVFGTGLGTYETAFLKYQTANVDLAYTFAHNDYLQLASELGAVGFLIFGGLFAAAVTKAVRAAYSEEWNVRLLGLGCTGALTAIGIHSLADFNLYIPANALLLSWIVGISICLPPNSHLSASHDVAEKQETAPRYLIDMVARKTVPILFSCLLVAYSMGGLFLETKYENDPHAENLFCRFGMCDPDIVLAADGRDSQGSTLVASLSTSMDAVKRDPADPGRWCDLGDAFLRTGRLNEARYSFSRALTLGPEIPLILVRAAKFHHVVREDDLALKEGAHVLERSELYQAGIFDWYRDQKFSMNDILCRGLPPGPRAAQSYLRYWTGLGEIGSATTTWDWILSHHYADLPITRDYIAFLFGNSKYQEASDAWALFLDDHRNGYRETNWVFNGDFEAEPSGVPLDWQLGASSDQVETAIDSEVAYTGKRSLRIRFAGTANVNYADTWQKTTAPPGNYRFTAFIRTEDISTDKGITFRIFDPENASRLDVKTEQFIGSTGWRRVEQTVRVASATKLIEIQVIREPTMKFDNKVSGTAWIDDLSLSRIE